MLSSSGLGAILESHSIFDKVWLDKNDENDSANGRAFQHIHISSGNFFIWENKRSCLLTTNLRETLTNSQENIQVC